MTVKEALKEFVAEQEYKGNSPRTIEFYESHLLHFLKDTGVNLLAELNENVVRGWLVSHRHLSPNTLRTCDRCLRVVFRWFYQRGYIGAFPMANLPKPKAKEREIVVFSEEDVRSMLAEAKKRQECLRDEALILLLLDTGIRIGEACNLTLHAVNWTEHFLEVDGKTGVRSVPFGSRTKRALRSYIDLERRAASVQIRHVFLTQGGTPIKSVTLTKHVQRIARTANVKSTKRGPHTFRHTFAVEFLRAGGDVFSLQKILGHSTLEMTRRYVHLAKSDLREAHRKFSPVSRML
jgi:site-specific recombinase XerD